MADPRYIRGDTRPAFLPVLTAQAVDVGDLTYLSSGNVVRAEDATWGTAVATPTAPTVADGAVAVGSPLTNAATGVKISYQFAWGEGIISSAGSATPTAGALLKVSGAPLVPATNALWTNIYVETAAGSGTYKKWGVTYGSTVMVDSYGTGHVPYANNVGAVVVASGALEATQYVAASAFAGVSGQRKDAAVARCYGNSTDNLIRVDGSGVWEFDCASATFAVGDFVGPAKDSGNALLSNKVVAVGGEALAVGRVVEAGTSLTRVKVDILSVKMPAARQ